jgi:RNA polymerase sigma factor (sigma-70 family)
MDSDVDALVQQAREGNAEALEQLVVRIQDRVYGLAVRMLAHPADAEDASQEILIKIVTHLADFRGESSFTSWVYRIACNHLLTTRKRRAERQEFTFESCEQFIEAGVAASGTQSSPEAEQGLIMEELLLSCTQTVLLCLDRNLRIAYVLSDILDMTSSQGAAILDISPAAFRQRVSRGRKLLRNFMRNNCGHIDPSNRCTCAQMLPHAVRIGWIVPDKLLFSTHPSRNHQAGTTGEGLEHMEEEDRVHALFRSHPDYIAPKIVLENLRRILQSVRLAIQGDQIH